MARFNAFSQPSWRFSIPAEVCKRPQKFHGDLYLLYVQDFKEFSSDGDMYVHAFMCFCLFRVYSEFVPVGGMHISSEICTSPKICIPPATSTEDTQLRQSFAPPVAHVHVGFQGGTYACISVCIWEGMEVQAFMQPQWRYTPWIIWLPPLRRISIFELKWHPLWQN